MISLKKIGLVFDPVQHNSRPDWMKSFAQAPNAVLEEDYLRVYFCTRGDPDKHNMYISRLAYVDFDPDTLEVVGLSKKPCLELGDIGTFDEFGTYPVSVLKHDNNYYAAYGGWTRCESVPFNISMGMSQSSNHGRSFNKFGRGPVLAPNIHDPFVITSPKLRFYKDTYVMTYTAGYKWIKDEYGVPEIIYKLKIAFSNDLRNWTRTGENIIPDVLGDNEAQACGDIFLKDDIFHLFFCYRQGLDFRTDPDNSYRIGYASSKDLRTWDRKDELLDGFNVSSSGWDSQMIAYPNLIKVKDRVLMFYGGNGNGKTGFGCAEVTGI